MHSVSIACKRRLKLRGKARRFNQSLTGINFSLIDYMVRMNEWFKWLITWFEWMNEWMNEWMILGVGKWLPGQAESVIGAFLMNDDWRLLSWETWLMSCQSPCWGTSRQSLVDDWWFLIDGLVGKCWEMLPWSGTSCLWPESSASPPRTFSTSR